MDKTSKTNTFGFKTIAERLQYLHFIINQQDGAAVEFITKPQEALHLPKTNWLPEGSSLSFVDVKLAHDVKARYRSAYKQALADLQAWKRHADHVLVALSFGVQTGRIATSNRQIAVYLYFDGQVLARRLHDMRAVHHAAHKEAEAVDTTYRSTLLQPSSLYAFM